MPFVPLVAMGSLVFTLVNFFKSLSNGKMSAVVTQLIAWVSGILVVLLFAQTDWADSVTFGDSSLHKLNGMSQLVIGLMAASLFGVVTELKKAIDPTDSAVQPSILPGDHHDDEVTVARTE